MDETVRDKAVQPSAVAMTRNEKQAFCCLNQKYCYDARDEKVRSPIVEQPTPEARLESLALRTQLETRVALAPNIFYLNRL